MLDARAAVYQLHAAAWLQRSPQRVDLSDPAAMDAALAATLAPYVRALGFTHIELLAADTPAELPQLAARCAGDGLTLLPRIAAFHEPPAVADFADRAWRFAALRAELAAGWARPEPKRLAMGVEFAQPGGPSNEQGLAWHLLADPLHEGVQRLVHDLNHIGLEGGAQLVVHNPSTTALPAYRLGVAQAGRYVERIASASAHYGGGEACWPNGELATEAVPWDGFAQSLVLNLPALCTSIFERPR